ncbi:MAG: hypothetical protein IJV13_10355 [Prevotella sp.]|nr:hypothetical protein [Prevotella sp.]
MTEKTKYEKPLLRVIALQQQGQLLAGSGLDAPTDYPEQPDPLNFSREPDLLDF